MNHLKKIILFTIILSSTGVFSQKREPIEYLSNFDKKAVRWGFYLGLNNTGYKLTYTEDIPQQVGDAYDNISVKPTIGFNVGLIGDFRLHKNINFRLEPGIFYNSRVIHFDYLIGENNTTREAASTFLYVPLLMQFSANRYKNIRPYVSGGLAYGYNFTSNYNSSEDNFNKKFRLQANTYFYEIGLGMDFYFYYFKFSPSIRGVFAINNELQRDQRDTEPNSFSYWTTPIKNLRTTGVFIRFTFQ